ncbi:DUF7576 family protein [Haloprofundus halobius]|uniref:DUF7576 family protein n=1 Tax=Haloprofundus halobius TaxID=2876194 RepID=UPI001CCD33E2|nr:hypothetical protein [Haloprofundus halobius]
MRQSESVSSTISDRVDRAASDAEPTLASDDERATDTSHRGCSGSDRQERCQYCGATIDTSEWYPVATVRNGNCVLRIYPLCGDDCREKWDEAHHR